MDGLRILRMSEVEKKVGAKRSRIYDEIAQGLFPQSIAIFRNGRARGWLSTEVDAYLDQRINERNNGESIPAPLFPGKKAK